MDSNIKVERTLTLNGGTPKLNQWKVFHYLNECMVSVINDCRKNIYNYSVFNVRNNDFIMTVCAESDNDVWYNDWGIAINSKVSNSNDKDIGKDCEEIKNSVFYNKMFYLNIKQNEFNGFENLVEEVIMPNTYDKLFGLESIHTHEWPVLDWKKKAMNRIKRIFGTKDNQIELARPSLQESKKHDSNLWAHTDVFGKVSDD